MPRYAADGCELNYETYGSGPPVVLLHGFTSLGSSWVRRGWIDALAGFRAVTLDLPGHGESDPVEDTSTPRLASLVVALLDELDLEPIEERGTRARLTVEAPFLVVRRSFPHLALSRLYDLVQTAVGE